MRTLVLLALALETVVGAPAPPTEPLAPPAGLIAQPASPQSALPDVQSNDPRIRVVRYTPNSIVELRAALGYQMMIEFGPDEKIENVAIGDSLGWQITPNKKADLLFVKPMDKVPVTNMTVVTNQRTYLFEMIAGSPPLHARDRSVTYVVEFSYPPDNALAADSAPAVPPMPQVVNSAYSYTGSTKTLPSRIFDDGHSTYFQFREGEDYPAIFSDNTDKGEAVVNSTIRGTYIVVDEIARGFMLRRGNDTTHIFNDGFRDAQPGPLSPAPRKDSCGKCVLSCWMCL